MPTTYLLSLPFIVLTLSQIYPPIYSSITPCYLFMCYTVNHRPNIKTNLIWGRFKDS